MCRGPTGDIALNDGATHVGLIVGRDGSGNLLLYNSTNRPLTGYVNFENNQFTAGIRLVLVLDDDKINRRK